MYRINLYAFIQFLFPQLSFVDSGIDAQYDGDKSKFSMNGASVFVHYFIRKLNNSNLLRINSKKFQKQWM